MSGTICFGGVCIPINAIWPVIVLGLKWLFEKLTGAPPTIEVALDERPIEQLPTVPYVSSDEDWEERVAKTKEGRPLVVDFTATWCGPCKAIGPVLEEIANELGGQVQICKVNIDDNRDLAVELGIQSIPTLQFYKDGEKKSEQVGLASKGDMIAAIQAL